MLNEGDPAPDVRFGTMDGGTLALSDMRGGAVVLYFYPKDDTSGCTREAQDFTHLKAAFDMENTGVIGVSKDDAKAHSKFVDKFELKHMLVSDTDGSVCDAFGTWVEKSMYGRKYMGIERATFLIGPDARIAKVWRKVSVPGHADEVLAAARALKLADQNPLQN